MKSIVSERDVTSLFWKVCFLHIMKNQNPETSKGEEGSAGSVQPEECPTDRSKRDRHWCLAAVCFYRSTNVHFTSLLMLLFCPVTMEVIIALSLSLPPALSLRWHSSKTPLCCFIFSFNFLSAITQPPAFAPSPQWHTNKTQGNCTSLWECYWVFISANIH